MPNFTDSSRSNIFSRLEIKNNYKMNNKINLNYLMQSPYGEN